MLFGTMEVLDNELYIGGVSASSLVKEYQTPLYVYDLQYLKKQLDLYQTNFKSSLFHTRVAYASKAFLTKAMVRLLQSKQMSLDLVSGGEMITALQAGFDMHNSLIHGNNKSKNELEMCFEYKVGYIVIDNLSELEDVIVLAQQRNQKMDTLLRVNPGVVAHTHEYVITAKRSSKFGESIDDMDTIHRIMNTYISQDLVQLKGFHCHIGSQVFDLESYQKTIDIMTSFIRMISDTYPITIHTLNLGGGFGVFYRDGDQPQPIQTICETLIQGVEEKVRNNELSIQELIIEPGRSIVANAGITLYTVGYIKQTIGGTKYLFVDGGMSDNIRPALYQAQYSASVATSMNSESVETYTVAGKLCESGDVLIKDIQLPVVHKGDILAVYSTGAYTYSMASNYNRLTKAAVLFVEDKQVQVVVQKETIEDLLRNDL